MKKLLLLPALILALTACTGNVSFNEEEIQEIAKSQPEGSFDVLVPGNGGLDDGGQPVFIVRHKSSELNDDQRQELKASGYKLIISGDYEEYKADLNDRPEFTSIAPESISAIEILKDITPEISEKYGKGSENGVIIVTMKD